ncbi:hypothetical protein [Klebsiella aerogenes]|uniref:hypothetical protein n=1 Tax=Klebsiella aerogenes TaxID=548 RepID=UPI002FFC16D0
MRINVHGSVLTVVVLAACAGGSVQASKDTSGSLAPVSNPLLLRGPGPVINPDNSVYMDEKKKAEALRARRPVPGPLRMPDEGHAAHEEGRTLTTPHDNALP